MSKQNVTVRLEPHTLQHLDQIAQAMDRDRSWLMSHAIECYIEEQGWQVQAVREAVQKVRSGKARFVPHDEVFSKLEQKIKNHPKT